MKNHEEKTLDMMRSVLPCKRRDTAKRRKALVKKAGRRGVKTLAHLASRDKPYNDELPDIEEDFATVDKKTRINVGHVVGDRRSYDKVAPLMRWAPKVTEGAPKERLTQLRAMMPPTTIGRHAVTHVQFLKEFDAEKEIREAKYASERKRRYGKSYLQDGYRVQLLRKLLTETPYLHKKLNQALQRKHSTLYRSVPDPKAYGGMRTERYGSLYARKLLGIHDVKEFLAALHKAQYSREDAHPEWMLALDAFLGEHLIRKG